MNLNQEDADVSSTTTYEVAGKMMQVTASASRDRRYVEYIIEGGSAIKPLELALVLELCMSNAMKFVKEQRTNIFAKELN